MKTAIITDQRQNWFVIPDATLVSSRQYLTDALTGDQEAMRVLNLCRTGRYQGRGYYVSLLAEARGHSPVPDVKTIQNLGSEAFVRNLEAEIRALVQETLRHEKSPRFQLDVYLGKSTAHHDLSRQLFARVHAPLLRVLFTRQGGSWRLDSLQAMGLADVPLQDRAFVVDAVKSFTVVSSIRP